MDNFPGYHTKEILYKKNNEYLIKATRDIDGEEVLVKYYIANPLLLLNYSRIKHELQMLLKVNSSHVIKILNFEFSEKGIVIVFENFEGQSLGDYLNSKKLSLKDTLKIALAISEGLESLHDIKIVHQGLTLDSIKINATNGHLKIVDFGIFGRLGRDRVSRFLLYMSPEQTNYINGEVDTRSNLYSLGIIFYEILTGRVPFLFDDPLEIMHAHLALKPQPLKSDNFPIPRVVCAMIVKLLSKDMELRYQSASGLKLDLLRCIENINEQTNHIEYFDVGTMDLRRKFQIPKTLYGREQEIAKLNLMFDSVVTGKFRLALINGYSGVGKSSLVNNIGERFIQRRGLFCQAKYEQYKRNLPFSAIIQAISGVIKYILTMGDDVIARWKNNITVALNGEGKCLIDIIPLLEELIATQPELPEVSPIELENRITNSFDRIIKVFAKKKHPFIMFLDDLQWIDSASIKLIHHWLNGENIAYFFLIVAYRDNEVDAYHPLMMMLDSVGEVAPKSNFVNLEPITFGDTQRLVANTLNKDINSVLGLTLILYKKTHGNPFFFKQLFKKLYQDRLIEFDDINGWHWDIDRISQLKLEDNIIDLMGYKLGRYNEDTQKALGTAAVLGRFFSLELLAYGLNKSIDETYQNLKQAVSDGLLLDKEDFFEFSHDKVLESSYLLLSEQERVYKHRLLGMYIYNTSSDKDRAENIFSIVDHLNKSQTLITDSKEYLELAKLNYIAGCKAELSSAFAVAIDYFTHALNLLKEDIWDSEPGLAFELHFLLAKNAYLSGSFKLSELHIKVCLLHEDDKIKLASVVQLYMDLLFFLSRHQEAIDLGLNCLHDLDLDLPLHPGKMSVILAYLKFRWSLGFRKRKSLANLPAMNNEKMLSVQGVLSKLIPSTYMINTNLMSLITMMSACISVKYGNSIYTAFAYSSVGAIELGLLRFFKHGVALLKVGREIERQYPSLAIRGQVSMVADCFSAHLTSSNLDYQKLLKRTLLLNEAGKTSHWADYAAIFTRPQSLFFGQRGLQKIYEENLNLLLFHKKHKDKEVINNQEYILYFIRKLMQAYDINNHHSNFDLKHYVKAIKTEKGNITPRAHFSVLRQIEYFLNGNYRKSFLEALSFMVKSIDLLGVCLDVLHRFFFLLAYLQLQKKGLSYYNRIKGYIYFHINHFILWLVKRQIPENYSAHYELFKAEQFRSKGKYSQAMVHYDKALTYSDNISIFNKALVFQLMAEYHYDLKQYQLSLIYAASSRNLYRRWDCKKQVAYLEKNYPNLKFCKELIVDEEMDNSSLLIVHGLVEGSRAILGEIQIEEMIKNMLLQLIKNAGARKAVLLLKEKNRLFIQGEVKIIEDKPITNCMQRIVFPSISPAPIKVAEKLVEYVEENLTSIILDDAAIEGDFTDDPYIKYNQCKSLLCMPIINRGLLIGVLHLENNLLTKAFGKKYLEMLEIIASQLAISIENAILHSNLELKVEERTKDLTKKTSRSG